MYGRTTKEIADYYEGTENLIEMGKITMTENRTKGIVEFIASGIGWAFIFVFIMGIAGYDIIHEDDYYSNEYVGELKSEIEYLKEECDYYKYTGTYNAAVAVYLESIVEEYDEYRLDDGTIDDIRQRAQDCAMAETYSENDYSARYDYSDIIHSVNTDVLWAVHRNRE